VPVLLDKIMRAGEGRILRKLHNTAEQVNAIEDDFVAMSDGELRALTEQYRKELADGVRTLDEILPEAFATVREAAKRTLGQRHYDVQIMGGAALHLGNIAEMKTGEGKTLVATLPAYLNALTGTGVHQVTVNDYLAERDSEWMGRIYRFLGLSVGVILAQMPPAERRKQYACDITYGTNNEFGFDYLRDNMAWSADELVQRGHGYAIVDEVDSILIDEARTPLIISGPADQATKWYTDFAALTRRLNRESDYEVDEKKRTVGVLEPGIEKVEDWLGIDNLYESVNTPLVGYLNNAIKAKELYKRDKDYVILDGEVLIVDEHTGRILHGRRYNEGMHQAIEAKEGVQIKDENQTLATITLQNYFRMYDKLAGMTGTAMTEAAEFDKIYKLGVVPIPTNMPMIRIDQSDLVYKSEPAKFDAVVEDIVARNEKGQPILVGTTSVEKSEYLSGLLKKRGVRHEVLNAKQHEREAAIVAEAGRRGAVTVATNMAGRGTDIMLGGNPEFMAMQELKRRDLDPAETPEEYEKAWPETLAKLQEQVLAEHEEVVGVGGLYVLGTERHESRRIDNQLRGRSGRQGDPGESRFYLSLGDDLMRLFKAALVERVLTMANVPEDLPIESRMVSNAIRSAQTQLEQQHFEIRKNILKYDEVLNRQRQVIYAERRRVLHGEDMHDQIGPFIDDTIAAYVQAATSAGFPEEWDLDQLWNALRQLYPISLTVDEIIEASGGTREGLSPDFLSSEITADAHDQYARREAELGSEVMRELERRVILSVLDRKWREHLYEMDYLQEGIALRAYAQRDPLVEYQREGFDLFGAMMDAIKEESVAYLFNVEVQVEQEAPAAADGAPVADEVSAAQAAAAAPGAEAAAAASGDGAGATAQPARTAGGTPAGAAPAGARPAARALAGAGTAARSPSIVAKGLTQPKRPARLEYSAPTVDGAGGNATETRAAQRSGTVVEATTAADHPEWGQVPKNASCPCGSGRKFKRCHGAPAK
jgi:preprotein translocase subunit SecA